MRLLVVGGYGIFGGRIVQLLESEPRLILLVAGRSLAKAEAWCKTRTGAAPPLVPTRFDRNGDVAQGRPVRSRLSPAAPRRRRSR
ncbi:MULTISPECIES: hypothetical protein [unclassified Mesorhizobium]|jgi:hypothetical protein|uniref:hypothetical protein n=1 Tax=unclassified Mesorhizobium TaxID=325217 RepID=UPI0003CE1DE6|nr:MULTISPECIES: hypothetical protein [unclassified Mesorhizobium]ESY21398.1 hypothetical protein X750_15105 [Mesorhizobium sp. LNJC394B00]ESY51389.1 hypothetical protein X745_23200 [Mesorhizobium sp. LNJC374B00]ESY56857.1 hypothetical protein X744_21790 [Mesorhizobium sp. LNJC372A00]ESZ05390.1 hypothetical protein X736_19055 [Mesorhizobium sp. L2C089B000]WJI48337.1 hypothetical protein NL532_03390 [Mesorhizobium sp. C120A]